jgi:hypothetical protein
MKDTHASKAREDGKIVSKERLIYVPLVGGFSAPIHPGLGKAGFPFGRRLSAEDLRRLAGLAG